MQERGDRIIAGGRSLPRDRAIMFRMFAAHADANPPPEEPSSWTGVWEILKRALGMPPEPRHRWIAGRAVEITAHEILIYDVALQPHRFPRAGIHEMIFVGKRNRPKIDLWIWYTPRDGQSAYETVYAGTFSTRSAARRQTERQLRRLGLMM
jgi:hypothetical protein